jgi:capsular polysaccharide biosynthesis protein
MRDEFSLLIDVRFEMADKYEVARITNMFLELVPAYINEFIPNSSTKVVTTSDIGTQTYPKTFKTTIIAMIVGALLAFIVVYVLSLFNTAIESEDEFKERYNIPVLGDIPDFAAAKSGKYAKSYYKGGNYYGN